MRTAFSFRDFRTSVNGILLSGFASSWRESVENSTDLFHKFNVHVEKYRFDGYFSHLTLGACKIDSQKFISIFTPECVKEKGKLFFFFLFLFRNVAHFFAVKSILTKVLNILLRLNKICRAKMHL